MSIQCEIKARIDEGRLVEFETIPRISIYRPVFLIPAVNDLITGPWDEQSDDANQMPYVRADLENFIANGYVSAAFGRGPRANFRRLEERKRMKPRVWEIRTMEPPPGHRLLGFFADQDVFVGVDLVPRDLIDFEAGKTRAKSTWVSLFGSHEPVVSENINDYISENVVRLRK